MSSALGGLRHLPSIDLYWSLWAGWLRRLENKNENVVGEYLGLEGTERYTQRISVGDLRENTHINSHSALDENVLLFSPHWAGIFGIVPGTDCGDQALEAFHSPWQKQLATLGKSATASEVLATMQELYNTWARQCEWTSSVALTMFSNASDPEHIDGFLLPQLDRSPAMHYMQHLVGQGPR